MNATAGRQKRQRDIIEERSRKSRAQQKDVLQDKRWKSRVWSETRKRQRSAIERQIQTHAMGCRRNIETNIKLKAK
jgi:hypothetical protein